MTSFDEQVGVGATRAASSSASVHQYASLWRQKNFSRAHVHGDDRKHAVREGERPVNAVMPSPPGAAACYAASCPKLSLLQAQGQPQGFMLNKCPPLLPQSQRENCTTVVASRLSHNAPILDVVEGRNARVLLSRYEENLSTKDDWWSDVGPRGSPNVTVAGVCTITKPPPQPTTNSKPSRGRSA